MSGFTSHYFKDYAAGFAAPASDSWLRELSGVVGKLLMRRMRSLSELLLISKPGLTQPQGARASRPL